MQTKALTPESYVFRFGKYKNMRAADVAELYELDKNGDDKPVGLLYLKFLVEKCDWFRHKDIIEQIINEISKANLSIKKLSTFLAVYVNVTFTTINFVILHMCTALMTAIQF